MPANIRALALLALVFPVIVTFEVALYRDIPWWKFEWRHFQKPFIVSTLGALLLAWFLMRGSRATRPYYILFSGSWIALSVLRSFQANTIYFGVSVLMVIFIFALYGWALFKACNSAYIDSGQRWFEGCPVTLPLIKGTVDAGTKRLGEYQVARLTVDGVYLLGPSVMPLPPEPLRLRLEFRDRIIEAPAVLIRERPMQDNNRSVWQGIGLQFRDLDLDLQKEIADFVELLRGEGYVS